MTRSECLILVGLLMAAAPGSAGEVKDLPAVNQERYPDSIGYLYQGTLATVLWLQNKLGFRTIDELERHLSRAVAPGLRGEVVASEMQRVQQVTSSQPTLPQVARSAAQSVQLLAHYSFVTRDYGKSLRTDLGTYNADARRRSALAAAAGRVQAKLAAAERPGQAGPLPV